MKTKTTFLLLFAILLHLPTLVFAQKNFSEAKAFCSENKSILEEITSQQSNGPVYLKETNYDKKIDSIGNKISGEEQQSHVDLYIFDKKEFSYNKSVMITEDEGKNFYGTNLKIEGAFINNDMYALVAYTRESTHFMSFWTSRLYIVDLKNQMVNYIGQLPGVIRGLRISKDGSVITDQYGLEYHTGYSSEYYSIINCTGDTIYTETYSERIFLLSKYKN